MKEMISKFSGCLCPECGVAIQKGETIMYGKMFRSRQGRAYHPACVEKFERRVAADDFDLAVYNYGMERY